MVRSTSNSSAASDSVVGAPHVEDGEFLAPHRRHFKRHIGRRMNSGEHHAAALRTARIASLLFAPWPRNRPRNRRPGRRCRSNLFAGSEAFGSIARPRPLHWRSRGDALPARPRRCARRPRAFRHAMVNSPIGPAPNTATVSLGCTAANSWSAWLPPDGSTTAGELQRRARAECDSRLCDGQIDKLAEEARVSRDCSGSECLAQVVMSAAAEFAVVAIDRRFERRAIARRPTGDARRPHAPLCRRAHGPTPSGIRRAYRPRRPRNRNADRCRKCPRRPRVPALARRRAVGFPVRKMKLSRERLTRLQACVSTY